MIFPPLSPWRISANRAENDHCLRVFAQVEQISQELNKFIVVLYKERYYGDLAILKTDKPPFFVMTVEILNKIMNTQGPFIVNHLVELYRMREDETSREAFVTMLAWKYQKVVDPYCAM